MPNDTQRSNEAAKQFLLAEYARFAEAFWRNEATGETRVNWFIGIVTAALAGLVALVTKAETAAARDHAQAIVLAGLTALLVFGIVTFARMITRNERTDQYKYALDSIRQTFQDHFDQDGTVIHNPVAVRSPDDGSRRKLGGLTHIVAAINAVVCGAIVGVGVYPTFSQRVPHKTPLLLLAFALALAVLSLSFWRQYQYAKQRDEESRKKFWGNEPNRAGGVVFQRASEGARQYLIVHPYMQVGGAKVIDESQWVLPKGKINPGESQPQAAIREVREEAGVKARIVCPLGLVQYKTEEENDQDVRVKFYLMERLSDGESFETGRKPEWHKRDEAIAKLSHPESKQILARADSCWLVATSQS
jgi:8-oxo-dGTP pyrophosphatase MutT (NUDIX family)/uncharacterized membrane protein YedE/YeeE